MRGKMGGAKVLTSGWLLGLLFLTACGASPLDTSRILEIPEKGTLAGEEVGSDADRNAFQKFDAWLDGTFGPAREDITKAWRSKFIVAVIGHYAANRIEKWSGDHMKEDAGMMLLRLQGMERILPLNSTTPPERPLLPETLTHYNRYRYLEEVAETIQVAVRPTKRRYSSIIVSLLGPFSPVAAAKTAAEALRGIAEVTLYKVALGADLRNFLEQIDKAPTKRPTESQWRDVNEFFYGACERLTRLADAQTNPCTITARFRR